MAAAEDASLGGLGRSAGRGTRPRTAALASGLTWTLSRQFDPQLAAALSTASKARFRAGIVASLAAELNPELVAALKV